jgi:DNA-directed RNA polymerase specialized sigma24 family protein
MLILAAGDPWPHAEIAATHGAPEGTVGSRLNATRANVKWRPGLGA